MRVCVIYSAVAHGYVCHDIECLESDMEMDAMDAISYAIELVCTLLLPPSPVAFSFCPPPCPLPPPPPPPPPPLPPLALGVLRFAALSAALSAAILLRSATIAW